MQICNIYKYVTFTNMFIFSLNRLTPCHTAVFDTKQNKVEAMRQCNLFFFFFFFFGGGGGGGNKTPICMTGICAKFPFNRHSYIFLKIFLLFINKLQPQV